MSIVQKTTRYLKRNGFRKTYYAVRERLFQKDVPFRAVQVPYEGTIDESFKFSILVPVYETDEKYLKVMIESVLNQVYSNFELILADASVSDGPEKVIKSYDDARIKYIKVQDNKGISSNTNIAIESATGDYCCLLDHDDFIAPDALYENAVVLTNAKNNNRKINLIYSDEDKCDGEGLKYFEPHYKEKLNLDLLMSNNYICHFAVVETELLKRLKLRSEFDGAQDYDLFLRIINNSTIDNVEHIGRILYHWRCHEKSTASNPESKEYAYVAGKRAVEDFFRNRYSEEAEVVETDHKGFYRLSYKDTDELFLKRKDVGAVGSVMIGKNKITRGIYTEEGRELLLNLNRHYSGYMHRAVLQRDVFACDIRTVVSCEELRPDYDALMNCFNDYAKTGKRTVAEIEKLALDISLEFGRRVKAAGKLFLYDRFL